MNAHRKNNLLSALIILAGIFLDQLTKGLCVRFLKPVGSVRLIPGVVDLTYVENRGAAFGMLADKRWVFMVVSTVAILVMSVVLFTMFRVASQRLEAISLAMIVSGGIGNMIDRVYAGYVVDFIDVSPLFSFAVFNGADSFVCVGAGLLILAFILEWVRESRSAPSSGTPAPDSSETDGKS